MNTRRQSAYLRGIAILAVCLNHFLNRYVPAAPRGYAGGAISIFFLLSGYGIGHHLPGRHVSDWLEFFGRRAQRIYPLFWLWCYLHGFFNGTLGFFALDIYPSRSAWFVPAIVLCYVATPALVVLLERHRPWHVFAGLGVLILAVHGGLVSAGFAPLKAAAFKGVFFSQFAFYLVGIILARQHRSASTDALSRRASGLRVLASVGVFAVAVNENATTQMFAFPGHREVTTVALLAAGYWMSATFLHYAGPLPLSRAVGFLGTFSYSTYLFHEYGFVVLERLGILSRGTSSPWGLAVWIVFLPILVAGLGLIESVTMCLIRRRWQWTAPFRNMQHAWQLGGQTRPA